MIFNQRFIESRISAVRLVVILLGFMWSNYSLSQTNFEHEHDLAGFSNFFRLQAIVECGNPVTFSFESNKELRSVMVSYDGGPFVDVESQQGVTLYSSSGSNLFHSPHTNPNSFPDGVKYSWKLDFSNFNTNANIVLKYEHRLGLGWNSAETDLEYSHFKSNNLTDVGYQANFISPNNFSFDYTGAPLLSIPGVDFYSYSLDIGDGEPAITGSSIVNPLLPSSTIGNGSNNPHFYCRANSSAETIETELIVDVFYSTNTTHLASSNSLSCPFKAKESIELIDLCQKFTGFEINNIAPNEFNSEVTSSSSGNAILDGMVDGVNVSVSGNGFPDTQINGITGADQTSNFMFPNGVYQNYNLTETITIEPGCVCTEMISYNTANPCYNLSPLIATQSYANGEYIYTFNLSQYTGGASGNTITSVRMDFGDGTQDDFLPGQTITHVYTDDGNYTVTQTVMFTMSDGSKVSCPTTLTFGAETYCCINFAPEPSPNGYWLSAWVKEDHPTQQKTYENAYIELSFGGSSIEFRPSGDIIEGWQRIVGKFNVPGNATDMQIDLVNDNGSIDAYFDDIRVHPFNASMKSYVYDPETLWLTAEMDDNNYATFYEYDKEGQLIRIKKETARGIMTIQESRSSNPKEE